MITVDLSTQSEDMDRQRDLLATYRRTLAHLLQQGAQYGGPMYAPPQILDGIVEAHEQIAQIKAALHAAGIAVEGQPDDQPSPQPLPTNVVGGDQINAQESQGFIGHAAGPVAQNFGEQQNIHTDGGPALVGNQVEQGNIIAGGTFNQPVIGRIDTGGGDYISTGGGDYAGRDIDKRAGNFVGGSVQDSLMIGVNQGAITVQQIAPAMAAQERRNRSRMLQKVRDFWVKGVLEKSLYNAAPIELGLETRPDAVVYPWDTLIQQPDREARRLPTGMQIADVFDELGGELLILGAPGSGKSTMLLTLARELIARTLQDEQLPIPVVFNLSSWAEKQPALVDWVVEELNTRYDVPRKIGQAWVDGDMILPLLDGLDEVKDEHRAACVEAINRFRQEHGNVSLVVCSRADDYHALPMQLKLQGAVLLQPLTAEQIDAYLERAGDSLAALRHTLAEDAALRELTASPLMLSIMALTYQDAPQHALAVGSTPEEWRTLIFERYVAQMFKRRSKEKRYSPQQTKRWLGRLATALARSTQTLFFIEHLQPDWLSTARERRMYTIGEGLAWGLIAGLIVGTANELMSVLTAGVDWYRGDQPNLWKWMLIDGPIGAAAGLLVGVLMGALAGALPIEGRALPAVDPRRRRVAIRSAVRVAVIVGLAVGVARGLTVGLVSGPPDGLKFGVVRGCSWAVGWGAAAGLSYWLVAKPDTIAIVETLRWSWLKARRGIRHRLKYAALLGFVIGLAVALVNGLADQSISIGLADGLDLWLATALAAWLTFILIEGLTVAKAAPNQGIWRLAGQALKVGVAMWLVGGAVLTAVLWMRWDAFWGLNIGLGGGLVLLLIGGLLYGGLACLQHVVLRVILWRSGTLPWNIARFLDYAAERIFLHKVGGGYIFVHRLLMEYFAGLDTSQAEEPQRSSDRRGSPDPVG